MNESEWHLTRLFNLFPQDHFTWNPLSTSRQLYAAIQGTTRSVVICHETDPQWRSAVLNDADRLFSFRRIDSGTTQQCYRFIMMNKQTLAFQVIKVSPSCRQESPPLNSSPNLHRLGSEEAFIESLWGRQCFPQPLESKFGFWQRIGCMCGS